MSHFEVNSVTSYIHQNPILLFSTFFELIGQPWFVLITSLALVMIAIWSLFYIRYKRKTLLLYESMLYDDELTGLKNSFYFKKHFNDIVLSFDTAVSIYYINIDNFKNYNDIFGHHLANLLLKTFSNRLLSITRNQAVYRVHSDHFLVVNRTIDDVELGFHDKLFETLEQPYHIDKHQMKLTLSIGRYDVTEVTPHYDETILKSELALQEAKRLGKDQMVIYSESIKNRFARAFETFALIKEALANGYFFLEYQPIVEAKTLKPVGVEALLRIDYNGKSFTPVDLLEYAEQFFIIDDIDLFVIDESFKTMQMFEKAGIHLEFLSINISASEMRNKNFVETLVNQTMHYDLNPENIVIEFTETQSPETVELEATFVKDLRDNGFKVAMDDFGSGYAALIRLSQNIIDKVKIDKSFVLDIANNKQNQEIVKTMISLAKVFKLDTIVEGIESEADFEVIKSLQPSYLQGFLYHKPLSKEKIIELFKEKDK